jgi:Rrf2 family transcriptional regulator, iron-sulfur cluster assembly transcription factor
MFSRSSGYAIQALTYLAAQPSGRLVGAREIATSLQIPMPFLWKILRKLSQEKLVRSFKGVHGGYELARPASSIRLSEVLLVGHDSGLLGDCVLGLSACDEHDPCALHEQWKDLRAEMERKMKTTRLSDLVRRAQPGQPGKGARRNVPVTVQRTRP